LVLFSINLLMQEFFMKKRYGELEGDSFEDRRSFAQKYPRLANMKDWLFTSRMVPTTMQVLLTEEKVDGEVSRRGLINESAKTEAFNHSVGGFRASWGDRIKHLALNSIGIDGYDPLTGTLTCADGKVVWLGPKNLTWTMVLVSLFGLPSRPETTVVESHQIGERYDSETRTYVPIMQMREVPQYSFLQFLRNMIGGWNPVEEKLKGYVVEGRGRVLDGGGEKISVIGDDGEEKVVGQLKPKEVETLTQNRWTEKKRATLAMALIRVPFFVIFNLVTWPFKLVRNLVRAVTEIALPVFSMGVIHFNLYVNRLTKKMRGNIHGFLGLIVFGLPYLVLAATTLTIVVFQYALSLVSRIAKAAVSPLTNALLAYNSGVLILGPENTRHFFSRFVGGLGFVLSMALSITVWTFTLPLALGALVNAVPALLTPITALAQSPFIANVLAWLTQLPFVTVLSTAFGTAFGVVGAALTATFGAAIGSVAAFVGVAIPQVVVAFSLIMAIVVMPTLTAVTWGVEALSNAIMQWVEQRPVHTLVAGINAGLTTAANALVSAFAAIMEKASKAFKPKVSEEEPLISKSLLDDDQLLPVVKSGVLSAAKKSDVKLEANSSNENTPKNVYVYQHPNGELVVSDHALELGRAKKKGDELVLKSIKGILLTNPEDKKNVWKRANSDRSSTQKAVLVGNLDLPEPAADEEGKSRPIILAG